jgi:cytochrome c oxidase subunit 2
MSAPIPPSAIDWGNLFEIFLVLGVIAMTVVMGAMLYFLVKYRFRGGEWTERPLDPSHEYKTRWREAIIFASISFVILFGLAVVSYRAATYIQNPPNSTNSYEIKVTAFQWNFRFTYPNGYSTVGVCNVPANQNVVFNVTSTDVMHNFGMADFKIKIDAIPGKYNLCWIETPQLSGNQTASYQIRCYELCGSGHTFMIANMVVMNQSDFNKWYNTTNSSSMGGM